MRLLAVYLVSVVLAGCGFPELFETMIERGDQNQDIESCEEICGLDNVQEADNTYGRRLHCQCKEDKCPPPEPCKEGKR